MYTEVITRPTTRQRNDVYGTQYNNIDLDKALKVYQHARETKQPVLCIIDDTIASKTRLSSQAVHPMEAASNQMSHLKGRMDYGHQAIGVMLACGELVLNYAILLYDKSQRMPHIRFHDLRHPYVKHTTKIFSLHLMDFQAQAYPDAQ